MVKALAKGLAVTTATSGKYSQETNSSPAGSARVVPHRYTGPRLRPTRAVPRRYVLAGPNPSFRIKVWASNGARDFASVLSKKQYTSRAPDLADFVSTILRASAGSRPAFQALMRRAHRSNASSP
jgi:hypothetical protein